MSRTSPTPGKPKRRTLHDETSSKARLADRQEAMARRKSVQQKHFQAGDTVTLLEAANYGRTATIEQRHPKDPRYWMVSAIGAPFKRPGHKPHPLLIVHEGEITSGKPPGFDSFMDKTLKPGVFMFRDIAIDVQNMPEGTTADEIAWLLKWLEKQDDRRAAHG